MGWVFNATPRPLYPWKRPGTHCIGGWVGPKAGLDVSENLDPTGIRTPDLPTCSESLYWLRYPSHYLHIQTNNIVANLDPHDEKPSEKTWPHPHIYRLLSTPVLLPKAQQTNKQTSKTHDCLRGWITLQNTHL